MAERDRLQVLVTEFTAEDKALQDAFRRIEKQSADAIKELRTMAAEARSIFSTFGSTTAGATQEQQKAARSTREVVKANDELSATIKDLQNQVTTQRNLWAGRVTDDEKFKESTAALRKELVDLAEAGNLTNEQMKRATQGIAYAQRGLDSAAKVASRGGLAWTAQIAIANQFGQELRNLGPAGNAASLALQAFQQQLGSAGSASQDLLGKTQLLTAGIGIALVGAVASATAAITKLASDSAAWAGDLLNASERLNTTAEGLQALRFAAQNANVSTSSLESSLQSLTRRAASAAEGTGPAADAYKSLGISVTDAAGMLKSSDVLLGEIADAFNSLEDPAMRSALAFQLMNRTGTALLPMLTEGSAGLSEMAQEADRLSLVMSSADLHSLDSFGSELGIVRDQFAMLGRAAAADFLPVLRNDVVPFIQNSVLPAIKDFAGTLEGLAGFLSRSEGSLTTWVTHVAKWSGAAVLATTAVRGLTTAVTAFGVATNTALPIARIATAALSALTLVVTKVAKAQADARKAVEELNEAIDGIPQVAGTAVTGLEQLQKATGKEGLEGAVETLASTLEGDAKNAFVALASQAIASGGDIETVGRSISRIFASVRQEAIETRVAATRELAETAAAAHSVIAASHSRAQDDLAQIEQWQAERERLQQQLAPYKAIDVTQQARGIQDHVKSLESQIRRLDDSIQSAAARTGNIAEKYAQSSTELNQAQTRYSMALADQAINAQLLNGELEDAVSLFDGLSASVADGADAAEATSSALNEVGLSINSINEAIRDLTEQRDAVTDDDLRDTLTAEIARLEEQKRAMLGIAEGTAKAAAKSGELEAALGSLAWAEKNLADAQERLNKSAPEDWDAARADVEAWQGTVDEIREAVESLDDPLEEATTWVTRLGRELDSEFKTAVAVSNLLKPAIERIKSEMRDLSAEGEHASKEMEILADQLKILEGLEGRIQLPEVKLQPRPDEGETSTQWLDDLRRAAKAANDAFSDDLMFRMGTLHESVDTNAERVQFLTRQLTDLWNQGRENTDVFRQYSAELEWLNDEMEHAESITAKYGQALFDNLQPIVKGLPLLGEYADLYHRVADATAAAVDPIQALRDEIDAIGSKLPTFLQGPLTLLLEQLDEFEENEALEKLGENADAARERVEALLTESSDAFGKLITELEKMGKKGDLASDVVDELVTSLRDAQAAAAETKAADEFEKLATAFQQLTGTGPTQAQALRQALQEVAAGTSDLAADAAALIAQLDQFETTRVAEQFSDLLTEIQSVGAEVDPFAGVTASVTRLNKAGELTELQVIELLQAIGNQRNLLKHKEAVDAATKAWESYRDTISHWLGTAPSEFDEMREAARGAIEDADELAEALEHIAALELHEHLLDLSDRVDGLGGSLLKVAADAQQAWEQFQAGGSTLDLITAGFESATAAVKAFDDAFGDGFDGNEFLSGLTGVGAGIGSLIGGPAVGEAIASIDGFVQAIIGDLSNGIAQINQQVKDMASYSRYLGEGIIQAFADANTEMKSRGGLAGFFGGKKAVIDEVEVKRLTGIAENVASSLAKAFGAVDLTEFREAFNVGIDEVIQQQILEGFMDSDEVQEAIKNITLALDTDDFTGARREHEKLQVSAEKTYTAMQQWNREMRNARGYAKEIEQALRAAEDVIASTSASKMQRAFATGAMGLREYAAGLQAIAETDVIREFSRQIEELEKTRQEAIDDGADPAYVAALDEQIRALGSAWAEALENGAHEAAQTIREILGTSVTSLQDAMRQALGSEDVFGSWGKNLTNITRNALITGFLEGTLMKGPLEKLGKLITDAVVDGVITQDEIDAIREAGEEVSSPVQAFLEMLDLAGLGLSDLSDAANSVTDSLRNVPQVFKATQAMWDSTNLSQVPQQTNSARPMSMSSAGGSATTAGGTQVHITVQGSIYGVDDFNQMVVDAVDESDERSNLSQYGRT